MCGAIHESSDASGVPRGRGRPVGANINHEYAEGARSLVDNSEVFMGALTRADLISTRAWGVAVPGTDGADQCELQPAHMALPVANYC